MGLFMIIQNANSNVYLRMKPPQSYSRAMVLLIVHIFLNHLKNLDKLMNARIFTKEQLDRIN